MNKNERAIDSWGRNASALRASPSLRSGHITRCMRFASLTQMLATARTSHTPRTLYAMPVNFNIHKGKIENGCGQV